MHTREHNKDMKKYSEPFRERKARQKGRREETDLKTDIKHTYWSKNKQQQSDRDTKGERIRGRENIPPLRTKQIRKLSKA